MSVVLCWKFPCEGIENESATIQFNIVYEMFINYLRFFIEYHNFITLVVFVICVWTNKAVFATMS